MTTETVTFTYTRGGVTFTGTVPVVTPTGGFPGGFPDASTTGAKVASFKTYTGSYTLTSTVAAPVVLDGYLFTGNDLQVSGPGIIIRNCKFTSATYWPLRVQGTSASWAQVYDNTFVTGGGSQCSLMLTAYGVALRNDVSGSGDGIRAGDNATAQDNYVHDLYYSGSEHNDGIDFEGTNGNMIVQHNTVIVKPTQTSCITVTRYSGTSAFSNVLVDNNLLSGAGYCIYGPGTTNGATTGIKMTNNKFSKVLAGPNHPNYGFYGPLAYGASAGGSGNVVSGNTDYESGAAISI